MEQSLRVEITSLKEDIERLKVRFFFPSLISFAYIDYLLKLSPPLSFSSFHKQTENQELSGRYEKELRLMGTAWHNLSQQKLRETITINRNDQSGRFNHQVLPSNNLKNSSAGIGKHQSWMKQQRERLRFRDGLVSGIISNQSFICVSRGRII